MDSQQGGILKAWRLYFELSLKLRWGSSVTIVSTGPQAFDPRHTSSEAHPASCPVGTGGPFPGGGKRGWGVRLTKSKMSMRYIPSLRKRLNGVYRDSFTFSLHFYPS
jgi:hypothetical protein